MGFSSFFDQNGSQGGPANLDAVSLLAPWGHPKTVQKTHPRRNLDFSSNSNRFWIHFGDLLMVWHVFLIFVFASGADVYQFLAFDRFAFNG